MNPSCSIDSVVSIICYQKQTIVWFNEGPSAPISPAMLIWVRLLVQPALQCTALQAWYTVIWSSMVAAMDSDPRGAGHRVDHVESGEERVNAFNSCPELRPPGHAGANTRRNPLVPLGRSAVTALPSLPSESRKTLFPTLIRL